MSRQLAPMRRIWLARGLVAERLIERGGGVRVSAKAERRECAARALLDRRNELSSNTAAPRVTGDIHVSYSSDVLVVVVRVRRYAADRNEPSSLERAEKELASFIEYKRRRLQLVEKPRDETKSFRRTLLGERSNEIGIGASQRANHFDERRTDGRCQYANSGAKHAPSRSAVRSRMNACASETAAL